MYTQDEAIKKLTEKLWKKLRKAIGGAKGDDQERTGGGLVCMSMRFTVSNPKGEPPSLHVTWTLMADCQVNQEQKQIRAASASQKHADTDGMLLSAS